MYCFIVYTPLLGIVLCSTTYPARRIQPLCKAVETPSFHDISSRLLRHSPPIHDTSSRVRRRSHLKDDESRRSLRGGHSACDKPRRLLRHTLPVPFVRRHAASLDTSWPPVVSPSKVPSLGNVQSPWDVLPTALRPRAQSAA